MFQSCSNPSETGSQALGTAEVRKPAFDHEKARKRTAGILERLREGQTRPTPTRRPQQDEEIFNLLKEGRLPDRPLSMPERRTIALCHARPTGAMTLDSRDLDSKGVRSAFSRLMRRLGRWRQGKALSYFAIPACSTGHDGWHIHCLVWDFIPKETLRRHARAVGFGGAKIKTLRELGELDYFRMIAYHLRQNNDVFGITERHRHKPQPKGAHSFLYSAEGNPKLLSALNMAKDKSVSDIELLRACPLFSNQCETPTNSSQESSNDSSQLTSDSSQQTREENQGLHWINQGIQVRSSSRGLALLKGLRSWFRSKFQSDLINRPWLHRASRDKSLGRAGPSG
jgi:hypothetical protein